jgi:hypothetical protein
VPGRHVPVKPSPRQVLSPPSPVNAAHRSRLGLDRPAPSTLARRPRLGLDRPAPVLARPSASHRQGFVVARLVGLPSPGPRSSVGLLVLAPRTRPRSQLASESPLVFAQNW